MNGTRKTTLQDARVDEKIVLSGLWISLLFVFAYVDILGFWRTDIVNGALSGEVPGTGFEIDQTFLALTTIYLLVPSLMVVVSLLSPARINRVVNLLLSPLYTASVVVTVVGENWVYYILGSIVEVVLLLAITRVAWTWRRPSSHPLDLEPIRNESAGHSTGDDLRCLIETRPAGMQPIVVTHHGSTLTEALGGATQRIEARLTSTFEQHEGHETRATIRRH